LDLPVRTFFISPGYSGGGFEQLRISEDAFLKGQEENRRFLKRYLPNIVTTWASPTTCPFRASPMASRLAAGASIRESTAYSWNMYRCGLPAGGQGGV
jgi:hypothetical protein